MGSMPLRDLLGDRQAEPRAARLPRPHLVGPPEALEDVRQVVGRDPGAGVGDGRSIDPAKYLALHPALGAGVNSKLPLFYLAIGIDDGLITTHGAMKKLLEDKGVKYTLLEVPGYGHEWKFWRLSLRDLLPRLFQQGGE